jgi:hypothetical protein
MRASTVLRTAAIVTCGVALCPGAFADVTIPYNEYSDSPTIGRGAGTSTDPANPGYGAMRIFIEKVMDYTDDKGPDALPAGQKVIFQRSPGTARTVSAGRRAVCQRERDAQSGLFGAHVGLYLQLGSVRDEFRADA